MDTFFKRILFAFLVCGSVIAVHLLYKKFTPIATQYISNNGCLTGCLGFLFYLIKKTFLYALLTAAIYWFSMLILDELFGLYRKLNIDSDWAMICIIVLSAITLVSYIRCLYHLITSIKHCKDLTNQEKLLEEFYREHSLDFIHTSTTQTWETLPHRCFHLCGFLYPFAENNPFSSEMFLLTHFMNASRGQTIRRSPTVNTGKLLLWNNE